jgi:hypothetical protein
MKLNNTRKPANTSQCFEDARRSFSKFHRIDLLAPKMGTTHKTLLDRLNPDNDYHKLSVEHLVMLTLLTGDTRMVEGLNHDVGLTVYEQAQFEQDTTHIFSIFLRRQTLNGVFAGLLEKALDDGRLDANEAAMLLPVAEDMLRLAGKLKANLQGIVESKVVV